MKFLLPFISLTLLCCAISSQADAFEENNQFLNDLVHFGLPEEFRSLHNDGLNRVKRRTHSKSKHHSQHHNGTSHKSGNRQALCPVYCISSMTKTLSKEFKSFEKDLATASDGMVSPVLYERKNFQYFCEQYHKGLKCLNRCKNKGKDKELNFIPHAFSTMKFLCIDHKEDFLRNLWCFKKSHRSVTKECDKTCGGLNKLEKLDAQASQAERDLRLLLVHVKLTEVCKFVDCQISCSTPIMDRTCGDDEPGQTMKDFVITSFSDSQSTMESIGVQEFWPDNCKKLAVGTFSGNEEMKRRVDEFDEEVEEEMVTDIQKLVDDIMGDTENSSSHLSFQMTTGITVIFFSITFSKLYLV